MHPGQIRYRPRSGFTLIELLTAIAVLGIAGTIFVSLFVGSLNLADTSRGFRLASQLAEEQLAIAERLPERFNWPDYTDKTGEFLPLILVDGEEIVNRVSEPATMPSRPRPYRTTQALYGDYTWQAFARLPESGANHIEVLIEITWSDAAKSSGGGIRQYAISTLLPRAGREGGE